MWKNWFIAISALFILLGCKPKLSPITTTEKGGNLNENFCDTHPWKNDTVFHTTVENFQFEQIEGIVISRKFKYGKKFVACIVSGIGLENGFVGVFISDSLGQKWSPCFCGKAEIASSYEILLPDLNFDGNPDILVDGLDGGVHGNSFSMAFLYNPKLKTFQRYPSLDLPNLSVDHQHKQIRARHYSSICGGSRKSLYNWQNKRLTLVGEAIVQGCFGDSATLEWTLHGNKKTTSDSIFINTNQAWSKFNNLLWKGFDREEEINNSHR
ncbi:MAG TPA: hypothetical protein PLC89_04235 [Haliscomenobacter sp.]|uniref:XAC2610-related protein n=1 Tax=Haliscomenobacter sp. TaxID=2717303 RepID=UPI002BCFCE12|nr:hypothetical protein [Haliscomenobacter sp.]HOY16474.1 hypothetical protein [Haliscomenobacter sp.]HPH17384.1 hypothetical protein [Haliscomenobacter sp.]